MRSSTSGPDPGFQSSAVPEFETLFDRPVIIVAAPRSGSTLLFETLAEAANVWTIRGESHHIIESLAQLNPNSGRVDCNRLDASQASPEVAAILRRRFARFLRDRSGREFLHVFRGLRQLRFLEKTPKNALRIPFMDAIFPDALFVFLFRDARANISSMMEAWRSGRWVTYPRLRGWQGPPWSLLLPPGWQSLSGKPLEQICAFQWNRANQIALDDLAGLPRHRWIAIDYQDLLDRPTDEVRRLCDFTGLEMDTHLASRVQNPLPLSRMTQTVPAADKWRRNEPEILSILSLVEDTQQRLSELTAADAVAREQ